MTIKLLTFLKKHAAMLAFVVAIGIAIAGSAAFALALRPCTVELEPGERIGWSLRQAMTRIDEDGKPLEGHAVRRLDGTVDLLCLGPGNECAIRVPGEAERQAELVHARLTRRGRMHRYADDGEVLPEGFCVGFFDFNLLPLPASREQEWRVELPYACLPPGAEPVVGTAHRLRNAYRPEFVLDLPNLIWLDTMPGDAPGTERYIQICDLRCVYRYNPSYGVVDHAELRFQLMIEVPSGIRRFAVRAELDLRERVRPDASTADRVALARAILRVQHARAARAAAAVEDLATLRDSPVGAGPLRDLADALFAGRRPVDVPEKSPTGSWAVQVASTGRDRRPQAEELRRSLAADGFPAYIAESDERLRVLVGPYTVCDQRVMRELRRRFTREDPFWVRLE